MNEFCLRLKLSRRKFEDILLDKISILMKIFGKSLPLLKNFPDESLMNFSDKSATNEMIIPPGKMMPNTPIKFEN
jgi:hypothetical protein